MSYKLLLVAPDGEYVTETTRDTIRECIEDSEDMGSRWIFFPFHFIIKDHGPLNMEQRVIEPPDELPALQGKSLKSVFAYLKRNGQRIIDLN
jgi:hypothetical protein